MMTENEMRRAGYTLTVNNNMYGCPLNTKYPNEVREFATEDEGYEYIEERINNQEL